MKNVIVTGVSRGLGKCFFELLAVKNINLIAIGRNFTKEQKLTEKTLISHDFCVMDASYLQQLKYALEDDEVIFINNAGTVDPIGSIGKLDTETFFKAMSVNCTGPVELINFLVDFCKTHKRRLTIINISTGAAKRPIVGWAGYCTTKAAMRMFLDVLAEQEKDSGTIRIIQVDPGVMDTDMQERIRKAPVIEFPCVNDFIGYKENGRLRKTSDVAKEILEKHADI